MEFYNVIRKRRSIRKYLPDLVPDEVMQRILEAVKAAPTACNRQPFEFLLVQSDQARDTVCECYSVPWLREAPLIAVALGNRSQAWQRLDGTSAHTIDVAIAMEHFVLAAAAEGLGTCWVCAFDQSRLHRALELDQDWDVVALTPIGYPAETPGDVSRKPINELFRVI